MSENFRSEILNEAIVLINGERNSTYGDPVDDFATTASLWETYLSRIVRQRRGLIIRPHDVAVMMSLLKIARISWSPEKRDHWADLAGYTGCGFDCVQRQDEFEMVCDYCENGWACDCGGAQDAETDSY